MKIIKVNITDIKEYDNNVKLHPDWQIEQIKKSIENFGYNDPIVIDENNCILEGHGRLKALKELGKKEIECIKINSLNDNQKKAYRLIHNKLSLNTIFNEDMLEKQLTELEADNFDLSFIGFDFNPFEEHDIEELELDNYHDDDNFHERKVICPNCNYTDYIKNFIGVS